MNIYTYTFPPTNILPEKQERRQENQIRPIIQWYIITFAPHVTILEIPPPTSHGLLDRQLS